MKILKNNFEKTFETGKLNFSIFKELKLELHSIKFKITVSSNEPIHDLFIGKDGSKICIDEWFRRMINQKVILQNESDVEKYFNERLFVNDLSLPYITKTIFQILEHLLPENITLQSIEYEENF